MPDQLEQPDQPKGIDLGGPAYRLADLPEPVPVPAGEQPPPLMWSSVPDTVTPYRDLLRLMVGADEMCRSPGCGLSMLGHLIAALPLPLLDLVRAEDPGQPGFPYEPDADSVLIAHAVDELARTDNDPWYVASIVAAVRGFAAGGHSGGSAELALEQLTRLLQHENLTPLTADPGEWIDRSVETGRPYWQSRRNAKAFSDDGGVTYTTLDHPDTVFTSEPVPPRS